MFKKLLLNIIAATTGLWLATILIAGVRVALLPCSNFFGFSLTAIWQVYLLLGVILGLLNFFLRPVLNTITLPLRIITVGLFGIVVNMALLWAVDVMFKELYIPLWLPLLYTTLIIWGLNIVLAILFIKND